MRNTGLKKLIQSALFLALTTLATVMIVIPIPATNGYINIGDTFVILSGLLLGKANGAIVGGVGSALADFILGYSYYAPITLIAKGIEGYISGYAQVSSVWRRAAIVAMAVFAMILVYFVGDSILYGVAAALVSLIPNIIQGIASYTLALLLHPILKSILHRLH